jgi:hypothetical protein
MTLYQTPGGTPLNSAGGFQGSAPGNPGVVPIQAPSPGVGLFPPNANGASGDSVLASQSRAALPANLQPGSTTQYQG